MSYDDDCNTVGIPNLDGMDLGELEGIARANPSDLACQWWQDATAGEYPDVMGFVRLAQQYASLTATAMGYRRLGMIDRAREHEAELVYRRLPVAQRWRLPVAQRW